MAVRTDGLVSKGCRNLSPTATGTAAWRRVSVLALLLLGYGLRVHHLDAHSLWWDELSTWGRAVLPFGEMLQNLFAVRNHVPLFFLLMRLWAWLGDAAFVLRYFSVLWGVVGVALTYAVGRQLGRYPVGLVSAGLLALSPFHIWYSQEARMYSLVAASVLAATWFLLQMIRRRSWVDGVGYAVCMLVAVYSHYLCVLIVLAHYAFFALHFRRLRRAFRRWLLSTSVVVGLFGAWAGAILFSGGFTQAPIGWISAARWYEPVLTLFVFAAGSTTRPFSLLGLASLGVCLLLLLGVGVRALWRGAATAHPEMAVSGAGLGYEKGVFFPVRFALCWLVVPMVLLWLISLDLPIPQKRSIYMDRYLITVLPAFVLLVAWGLSALLRRSPWLGAAATCIIVVAFAVALRNQYARPEYARDDWRGATALLEMAHEPGSVLLLRPSHTLPLAYYMGQSMPFVELPFLFDAEERASYLSQEMEKRVAEIAKRWTRAWLVSSVENTDPHGFPQARNAALRQVAQTDALKAWLDAHYGPVEEHAFAGVCLTLYDLSSR